MLYVTIQTYMLWNREWKQKYTICREVIYIFYIFFDVRYTHIYIWFRWSIIIFSNMLLLFQWVSRVTCSFFMSEAGKWVTLWVPGMSMFVRGRGCRNILKPFPLLLGWKNAAGISNRQPVMRQQNRISSIPTQILWLACVGTWTWDFLEAKNSKVECVDHSGCT